MSAIVIDSQPLMRLGMQRMLEHLPGIGPVHGMDPEGIAALPASDDPVLVVYGLSAETTDNWSLLRRLYRRMPRARILLLCDNIWLRVPSSLQGGGMVAHLPKSASIERMEAAIGHLLGDAAYLPLPASGSGAWQPHRHAPVMI